MPRSERKTALAGVRFSRRSDARGGQAPALRARKGFAHHAPFGSRRSRTTVSSRSFRTLMSIVRADAIPLKVRRTLMLLVAMCLLYIKDLKDLRAFFSRGYYRHAGPKGPEEMFSRGCDHGGQAPALRYAKPPPFRRRARACPSPCLDRENGFGWRAFFA